MDELRRASCRLDPGHGPAEAVGDPDRAIGVGDAGGRAADPDRPHLPGPRVQARQRAAGVGDPDAARADRHRGRARADGERPRRPVITGIDAQQLAGLRAGHPDRASAGREPGRRTAQPHRPGHPAGSRRDPGHGVAGLVGHPDKSVAERDRGRAHPGPDHRDLRPGGRIDLRHGAVQLVGHPDLAVADRHPGRPAAHRDPVDHLPRRIDPEQQIVRAVGHPGRARAVADPARPSHPGHDSAKTSPSRVDHADGVRARGQTRRPAGRCCHQQPGHHSQHRRRGQQCPLATSATARRPPRALSGGSYLTCCGLAGQVERRVLPQDRVLKPLQRRARFHAKLLDQRPARLLVGPQRLRLPPAPVQSDHQLPVQALA